MTDYQQDYIDDSSPNVSKINSAMLVNFTLNEEWKSFLSHYKAGKYLAANSDLEGIWIFLGGEKGVKGSDTEKDYNSINKKLSESGDLRDSIEIRGFGKVDAKQVNQRRKQKEFIMEKALFLRRLQNEQGKGTAYHDAGEDYMDG